MEVPKEYHGREQSYLKHRVLQEYLLGWGHKLGSRAKRSQVRLCYVDAFAGPWKSSDVNLTDTSIAIGLNALEAAASTWASLGWEIHIDAFFIEPNNESFLSLREFLGRRTGAVCTYPFQGRFEELVPTLVKDLGSDPALVFVDPTGWKGAAMRNIQPLLSGSRHRDVIVNVMFYHLERFKDDPRPFLRQQMQDFFGLASELPEGLDEEALLALYRTNLKRVCGVAYAADVAIPDPQADRTKFRLVVGGNHVAVLDLFRTVEAKVLGREAAVVRQRAKEWATESKRGQMSLGLSPAAPDPIYRSLHDRDLARAEAAVLEQLTPDSPKEFKRLWPGILEVHHITKSELGRTLWGLKKRGLIHVLNAKPREHTVKDEHMIVLPK